MLHLILGRAGFGKTHEVYRRIAGQEQNQNTILLVPEQYSFESERAMLLLPADRRAEVLSFSRLCDHAFKLYGGGAGTPIGEEEKLLLVTRALRETADRLHIYRRQVNSVEFALRLLAIVQECAYAGITPEQLIAAARELPKGTLKEKTQEIALILAAYHGLVKEAYTDPEEELNRLHRQLAENGFWQDKRVYIDSFKDFTAPQKKLVEQIIANAKEVTVTLCADCLQSRHNLELFANTKALASQLIRMANRHHIPVATPTILTENHRAKTPGMKGLEQVLSESGQPDTEQNDSIIVCACEDKYDEAEFVAAGICRLVREEGLRFREITVIARDPSAYDGILDVAFDRYEIPYFSDSRRPVVHQPLFAFALKALRLAVKGWDTDELLSYLKTGLAGFTLKEIALLENYAFTWGVKGRDWLFPFTHHPDGMGAGEPEDEIKERLNTLRTRAVAPLLWLQKQGEQGSTVKDYCTALFGFLEKTDVYERLQQMAGSLKEKGNTFQGEDVLRSLDVLNDILDKTVSAIGGISMTMEEFAQLFSQTVQSADMGKIPQGIDQVVIGSADRTRPSGPKAVFVLGANQGVFPGVPASGGLFSDSDRKALNQVDVPLSDHCEFDTAEENFLFYTAGVAASEKTFFTYLVADKEKVLAPCAPLERLKDRLPGCLWYPPGVWKKEDPLARAQAVLPAFDLLSEQYRSGSTLAGSLYRCFEETDPSRLQILQHLTERADCRLTPQNAKSVFGEHIFISPSGVEVYHKCAFSYFCRYGLRISPRRPVALDVLAKGTLVHYVLEQMLNFHGSKGLYTLDDRQLQSNIHHFLTEYVEKEMGGISEKAHTFRFQLERMEVLLISLLKHMAAEMKESRFETAACELAIGPDGQVPSITIPLSDGGTLSVVGVVDRLDVYEKDGITYFRVVDYKTGTKTFNVEDLYYGIGLQMFIYLFSVEKNGDCFGLHRTPAGVLYMPARRTSVRADGDLKKWEKEIADELRMKGLVLDDMEIVRAMDPHGSGAYIPVSFKQDGTPTAASALASLEFFGKTRKQIEGLLEEMGLALQKGNITCDPLDGCDSTGDACKYCDFKAVCPINSDEKHRKVPKMTARERRDVLKGGDHHGI